MASPLPNTVIQRSKQVRDKNKKHSLLDHSMSHCYSIPTTPSNCISTGKTDDGEVAYYVELGEVSGEYIISARYAWGVSLFGATGTEGKRYYMRLAGPPSAASNEAFNRKSWKEVDVDLEDLSTNPDKAEDSYNTYIPKDIRNAFDKAFEVVCTHWFFNGH